MMKKLTSLLLSAALMISLLACGAFAAKTKSGVRIAGLKGPTTMWWKRVTASTALPT